ncbi:MAG: CPBP family intramembrane glutamic endopeptidase [Woeseiaceae bacterium]
MTIIDHLLLVVLAVIHPIVGYFSFQRLLARIAAGEAVDRSKLYQMTITGQWVLFALTVGAWLYQDRSLPTLGFDLTVNLSFLIGVVAVALGIVLLVMQIRQIQSAPNEDISNFRGQLGTLEVIIPRNGNELARFYGLSLTAGIVEETLWRGFMIWYFSHFMPVWFAALISVLGFGIAHAYQGAANLPKVTLVGAVFAGLYLLSGSLWLSIIFHAAVDILQGRAAYEVLRRDDIDKPRDTDGAMLNPS